MKKIILFLWVGLIEIFLELLEGYFISGFESAKFIALFLHCVICQMDVGVIDVI